MIAQASAEEITAVLLWLCLTGFCVLVGVAVREFRNRPAPPAPPPFKPHQPGQLFVLALVLLVGMGVCQLLILKPVTAMKGIGFSLAGILSILAYARALRPISRPSASAGRQAVEGLVVTWMALPVIYGVALVVTQLGGAPPQPTVVRIAERAEGWVSLAFMAVLLAPVMEELIFRGALYAAGRQLFGKRAALVLTASLFGLIHPIGVWAPMTVYGLFLGYLVERSGTVWPCIVSHAAFNGLTVAQLVFMG